MAKSNFQQVSTTSIFSFLPTLNQLVSLTELLTTGSRVETHETKFISVADCANSFLSQPSNQVSSKLRSYGYDTIKYPSLDQLSGLTCAR